jgi:hypothetical protein
MCIPVALSYSPSTYSVFLDTVLKKEKKHFAKVALHTDTHKKKQQST